MMSDRTLKAMEEFVTQVKTLGYEDLKAFKKKIDELSDEQLRALYAYEQWQDGMEWEDVMELKASDIDRTEVLKTLVNIFGY